MKKNLLHLTHIRNDDMMHDLIMDLDIIKISGIADSPRGEFRNIFWHIPGLDEDNTTRVSDSLDSLKERIWGTKKGVERCGL